MIGKLRHRVTIEYWDESEVGRSGNAKGSWATVYAGVHAEIVTLSGRELEFARQLVPESTERITVRYHRGIDTNMRVVHGAKSYSIQHINNVDQRNAWLILTCTKGD